MNKMKLFIAPLLVLPFLVGCGGSTEEYKVDIPDTNGVTITPDKATKGKDYTGTISINTTMLTDKVLGDDVSKIQSGNKDFVKGDYTYTLSDDKLSAKLEIPAKNIVGDIAIQVKIEETSVDPHYVNEQEFIDATSFKNVEYLQYYEGVTGDLFTSTTAKEMSPTVYHSVETMMALTYTETFVKKEDENYTSATRTDAGGKYVFDHSATAEDFVTPGSDGVNLWKQMTDQFHLGYTDFDYDKIAGKFSADFTYTYLMVDYPATMTLEFKNKKVISQTIAVTELMESDLVFTYETSTPDFPKEPEPGAEYTMTFYEKDGETPYGNPIVITDVSPIFIFPFHGEDEGGWYCAELYGQTFQPGEKVTIPVESLDNYDFVWTPEE